MYKLFSIVTARFHFFLTLTLTLSSSRHMSLNTNQSLMDSGETKLLKLGPYGSENGGKSFDDGIHSTVRQLVISYDSSGVNFIQIEYDDNGSSFWSDKHGQQDDDDYIDTIQLDYPYEFLTSVHGTYTKLWRFPTFISSLTFRSNQKTYGPYGKEGGPFGKYFSIQAPGNMIVGFHGRSSIFMNLRAIGAYLKPLEKYDPSKLVNDSVVPPLPDPSNPLLPARYPKHIKKHHEEHNKQVSCIISDNQVTRNEGDRNGAFAVGNKYINTYYYYSEKFKEMYN